MPDTEEAHAPDSPVSEAEIINGIRAIAYGDAPENTRLRAWELLGKITGLFKDGPTDGGAPVVRLTPPLDEPHAEESEASDDHQ